MRNYLLILILFVPSILFASGFTDADGKWIEAGVGSNGIVCYLLIEPSPAFEARNILATTALKAKEEEQRSKKTPDQIKIEDLIKRVEALERK